MKKLLLALLLLSILFSMQQAEAIGLAHGELKHDFASNKEITVRFQPMYYSNAENLEINLTGDLLEYAERTELDKDGTFIVTINLPAYIDTPGTHILYVSVQENAAGVGTVGTATQVVNRIQVLVPYEGKYLRILGFSANNVVKGEDGFFTINVDNVGEITIESAYSEVKIYDNLTQELIDTVESEAISLGSFERHLFEIPWTDPPHKNGIYNAVATAYFDGQSVQAETSFHIGELLVEISDFSETVPKSRTAPLDINLESKWNDEIRDVYASVRLNGQEYKSYPATVPAWGEQTVTAYVDASDLEIGEKYPVELVIFYEGKTNTASGEIEIIPSSGFELDSTNTMYIGVVLTLLIIIYLLKRININISFKKKN